MKRTTLSKLVGAGVLAASLAVVPLSLPSHAQDSNPNNNPTLDTTPFQETKDDNNNLGWLGLIGLLGLANLFRKPKENVRYQEPDVVSRTGPGYRE
ncbi:MAG TPA: WGxxGxxG family protein [Candidatus Obscuribacterales bacterium]